MVARPESPAWPAIGSRAVPWRPTISPALLSRAQRERHAGPFEAAVVPSIATLTPRPGPEAAGAADDASAAIARFDAELGADIAPFAALLLRSESAASSQIENLSSGAKQIALAELGSREKRNATEIVGNVAAMRAALALAEHLDEDAVLAMHRALLQEQDPTIAGRWRTEPVWIGGSAAGPHGATYVAPVHEDVPGLMSDLVTFMRRTDVPLLVQAAVAHAQFETIHPFPDGNGRTGRALLHAMLRGHGLTRSVTVPVSAGLLTDTGAYFDALTAYREGQVSPIVSRLADAAFAAIGNGRRLVTELRALRADWDGRIASRRGSSAHRLADLLLRHNVVDSRTIASELDIRVENVGRAVRPLVDAGILTEFTGFTRNRMWEAGQVSDALDGFAARAGRRRTT